MYHAQRLFIDRRNYTLKFCTINEDKTITYAPSILTDNSGMVHYHPDDELYRQLEYLEIVDTPYPKDTETLYESYYVEKDSKAVRKWKKVKAND